MLAMRFLDTNILLYAISRDPAEKQKADIALGLLEQDDWALSVQVLQEFYVQATRVTKSAPLSHEQAVNLIESWLRFPTQAITIAVLQSALRTKARHGLSYWDAAILEAARAIGCQVVYSEDLSTCTDYDGIRVVNPFVVGPR